jgi:hypothetical protein
VTNEVVKNSTYVTTPAVGNYGIAEREPGRFVGATVRRKF